MSQQQDDNTLRDESKLRVGTDTGHDPVDGYEPVPLWLISIFGALLAWGGWYVGTYSANFSWIELDAQPKVGGTTQPVEDPLALGKRLFMGNCVSCHQADGKGLPGQYPPLVGSEWVNGNPAWMKRIVLNGLEGPITVEGKQFNNAMPAFGPKLQDKQIAAVISFVRTNKDWNNNGGMVLPESVAATRAAVKTRTAPWSPSELQAIQTDEGPQPQAPTSAPSSQPATAPASQPGQPPKT